MNEKFRILWYIYTRAIVCKGNNFTAFSRRDYSLFASVVAKDIRNIGALVFNELDLFRLSYSSSICTPLPFPHLISLFLKNNGIWYVETSDEIIRVPKFGRTQLAKMGLIVDPKGGHGEATLHSKRKRPEGETSKMDEVEPNRMASAAAPAPLEQMINNVVQEAVQTLLSSHLNMMRSHNQEIHGLFTLFDAGNKAVMDLVRMQAQKTEEISNRIQAFEALLPTRPNFPPNLHCQPTSSSHPSLSQHSKPSSPVHTFNE